MFQTLNKEIRNKISLVYIMFIDQIEAHVRLCLT